MICVVLLQDCVGFEGGEAGHFETCVMSDVDGTGEASVEVEDPLDIKEHISIKVEDAIDIKDGIPEAVTCTPINTELEVRLWVVFEAVAGHPCISPKL
jgi:hypothetical protein